jgi:hypothetical protein
MKLNQILDNNRKVSLMNLFKDVYEEIITVWKEN